MTQPTTLSLDDKNVGVMDGGVDVSAGAAPPEAAGSARRRGRAGAQATVEQNATWFDDNDLYIATQSKLEHYTHCKRSVEHELRGVGSLLDVGNGGFFNYDTTLVGHATAVDLFHRWGRDANTRVAVELDVDAYWTAVLGALDVVGRAQHQ